MPVTSYPPEKIKVLLLENVHSTAHEIIRAEGFRLGTLLRALPAGELAEKLRDVHVLGIRSKTQVTARALEGARRLLAVGAFCIGTNQLDLEAAKLKGVPVFNAPFSNTRSVAELVLAEVIALARQLGDRSREVHEGKWRKSAAGSVEVRGKTLGIVGYGHIGAQVGVLAEAIGMRVLYYDIGCRLAMGNNRPVGSLAELLGHSDFVTLHVPETPQTQEMNGAAELRAMPPGAHLLNLSAGTVVESPALAAPVPAGHLAGAPLHVNPRHPDGNSDGIALVL